MTTNMWLSVASCGFGYCLIKWVFALSEIKLKTIMIKNYEKDMQLMAVELKGIMSLNKMCIEKWEKAVLDNTNINQSNTQLIAIINDLQKKPTFY